MKKISLFVFTGLIFFLNGFSSYSQTYITQVKPAGNKLWGYANQKGDVIIEPKFEKCFPFSADGLAVVYDKSERQYYFINTSGGKLTTDVTGFKLRETLGLDLQGFSDGLIQIKIGDKWGYLSKTGKTAIAPKYDETSEFNSGYAIVRNGNDFMVIDTQGKETPVAATGILDIKPFQEKFAVYKTNDKKTGFIGIDGKVAIPAQFESVGNFSGGLAWAKSADKLGYINTKGDWVIKPDFDAGKNYDTESGLARVKKGEQWMYVNKSGETISISITESYGDFNEGLADGKKGVQKGFYNNKGTWAIEPQFDGVRDFKNGFAAAKKGDKWGVIDKQGKWVIEPKFDGIKDMELIK